MKSINFQKLSVQNFLSVGEIPLELEFSEGINIITGENLDNVGSKNGVGKSTILNSIFWIIFGETITDLKKSRIQHNKNKGECSGTLTLSVDGQEYTIKRTLEPASIKVTNNSSDATLSTIEKNNEFIQDLIGATPDVFKNSVILTSDNTLPFLALKKIDKRKFIEGVMNLDIFTDMLLKVRKDYNEKKKESDTTTALFTNEQRHLESLKSQKIVNFKNREKKIQDYKNRIIQNNQEIENIRKQDSDVDKLLINKDRLKKYEDKLETVESINYPNKLNEASQLKFVISDFDIRIRGKKSELNELQKSTGVCPSCKRPYSEDTCGTEDLITQIQKDISEIIIERDKEQEKETKASSELRQIKQFISELKSAISKLKEEIERLTGLDNEIKIIESKNDEILISISNIEGETDNIDVLINASDEKIKDLSTKIKEFFRELDILDHAKAIVSEDGVKTVIVKKILTFLNGRLNYYLSTLDAPVTCGFDENFDTSMKNLVGKEMDYYNLSGGERKRVDASVVFTFQDLLRLQTGINYNLSVYDEWLDSALDQKGIGKILEVLRSRVDKHKEAIYVVSHNPNTLSFDIDSTINLIKQNGVTLLKS